MYIPTTLFLGNLRGGEILLIALVVLLLFGGKKIPELMKGLGKGMKSFKEGLNEMSNPTEAEDEKSSTAQDNQPTTTSTVNNTDKSKAPMK